MIAFGNKEHIVIYDCYSTCTLQTFLRISVLVYIMTVKSLLVFTLFAFRTTEMVPEDSVEIEENTISPPDPSMIEKLVITDYNGHSDFEEDSIVKEVPFYE